MEAPDNWLEEGYPWEIPRWEVVYPVHFFGQVKEKFNKKGESKRVWVETEEVVARAYDVPIAGYGNHNVNNLRIWSAKPLKILIFNYLTVETTFKQLRECNAAVLFQKSCIQTIKDFPE